MALQFGVEYGVVKSVADGSRRNKIFFDIRIKSLRILYSIVTLDLARRSWRVDQPKREKFRSVFPCGNMRLPVMNLAALLLIFFLIYQFVSIYGGPNLTSGFNEKTYSEYKTETQKQCKINKS